MNSDLATKVLRYIEVTNQALGTAVKLARANKTAEQEVVDRVPELAVALKSAKLIEEHEVKLAEQQLSKHAKALEILSNVLAHHEDFAKEAAQRNVSTELGSSYNEKKAGSNHTKSSSHARNKNYVGYRWGESEQSEADTALLNRLLGTSIEALS